MAGIKGTNTRVLMGGYLLSSQTNSSEIAATLERIETTPFEATGKEYVTLPPSAQVNLGGYMTFDTANGSTFENRLRLAIDTADTVGVIHYVTVPAAVSYTHLDVYKRQVLRLRLEILRRKQPAKPAAYGPAERPDATNLRGHDRSDLK